MTRPMFEASDKIIEGTFSEPIDIEAVCRAINEEPECLKNAEITNGDGSLKLRNGDLVFLEILREKLKNKKSVGRVVTDAVLETYAEEYQNEGEEVLRVALEKYEEYYFKNLAGDGMNRSLTAGDLKPKSVAPAVMPIAFDDSVNQKEISVPWVESLVTVPARPFYVLSERGRAAMKTISDENLERLVLDAMSKNDSTRARYLIQQASETLKGLKNFGVNKTWVDFYNDSMKIESGEGNYPEFGSIQGLTTFFEKVYRPFVTMMLAEGQIASVMGDHAATEVVADLEAKMEIILAEKRAEVAEKVQPAQRRVDAEMMKTKADEADLYEKHQDVLKRSKKIKNELAMRTVVAPLSAGATEVTEAVFEVAPSGMKAFAEFFRRWYNQEGGDPKLVGITAGGFGFGIVAAIAMSNAWWLATPLACSALYMGVRGFMKK